MATTTKKYDAKKALSDYYVYVPLGAGQLFFEKSKEFSGKVQSFAQARRRRALSTYEDLAKRGEKLARSISRSAYTKRAIEQSKIARTQVKAATTSVRKAVSTTGTAAKEAAKKVS